MKERKSEQIDKLRRQVVAIEKAAREALLDHKRTGDPIAVCDNDKVRWIPADEINVDRLGDRQ